MPDPEGLNPIEPYRAPETESATARPDQTKFQNLMEEGPSTPPATTTPSGVTPMDVITPGNIQTPKATVNALISQTDTTQGHIHTMQKTLTANPNLKVRRSDQNLLQNKLENANDYLKAANKRMGVELPEASIPSSQAGPVTRFLAFLTDGQNQLIAAKDRLQILSTKTGEINPGELLILQVQLSQAQQELEYSSTLLGKVVDISNKFMQLQI